jgi:beta-glucosidase
MVARGLVTEGLIDKSVRRILRAKFQLGLFEPDQPEDPREVCDSPAHRELARQVARASHVLLANDGTLPLDPRTVGRVALIGPHGDRCEYGGYVGHIASEGITPLAGLHEILGESAELEYRPGCTFGLTGEQPEADVQAEGDVDAMIAEAVAAAGRADTVILALGGTRNTCGEGRDNAEISLPGRQHELARAVLDLGKPTVLVLIGGRPWAIGDIAPRCSAVLLAWYGGCEAGRAIAETLTGRHNPGGRLSMSFPRSEGHCPCTYLHRPLFNGSGSGSYRQHDNTPLYAFGHGLSYTTFGYGEVALSAENIGPAGSVTATVEVTNTGQRSGDEVVQCYVTDEFASVTQPLKQLRGFRRVHLAPGESTSVRFDLDADALAIWDARMERTVEPGWFTVQIGPSSTTGRSARFEVVTPEMPAPTAEQSGATVTRELDMEAPG